MASVRTLAFLLTILVLAAPPLTGVGHAQSATWKLQSLLNPGHMAADAELFFAKEIEKRSGGRLKVTVYLAASLGFPGPRALQTVQNRLLEASEVWGAHVAGDLRVTEVMELPGLIPYDIELRKKITATLWPQIEKIMGERFGIIPAAMAQVEPRNIYTKKPIRTLADLKGMKIRAQGPVETDFTRAIGATPVTTDWPEVYPALQQGVIDGYWVTHSATFNAKLHEIAKYAWDVGLGGATWYIIVNRGAFQELPADVQKMVREVGREAAAFVWGRVDHDIKDYRARLEKAGMTFTAAPDADRRAMLDHAKGVWAEWVKRAGPTGQDMVGQIQAAVSKGR
jgi:TRAP-type C4-dicarboxylate transport system substrate-binding protein